MNSIEKYDFNIVDVIKTSFKMTDGFKGKFWASFGAMMGIIFIFAIVFTAVSLLVGMNQDTAGNLANIIMLPIIVPIAAGLFMMTANYTRGESVSYKNIFDYFGSMWKLLGAYLLTMVAVLVPILLLVFLAPMLAESGSKLLASLALLVMALLVLVATISYMFAPQLLVDKNLTIWQAMESSRKATWQHLFKIIGLFLLFSVILLISAIPFGIGLIWTLPAMYIGTYGLLYRIMYDGVELDSSK